jgi:hypothetical protein
VICQDIPIEITVLEEHPMRAPILLMNKVIKGFAEEVLLAERLRIEAIKFEFERNEELAKYNALKQRPELEIVLLALKKNDFVRAREWLETILETADGNYLGFIILSK